MMDKMEEGAKKVGGPIKRFFNDFKAFAVQGNVIDLAVGVMIGTAFGKITSSLVSDIFMPLIGLLVGKVDFKDMFLALDGNTYSSIEAATAAGVSTLNYGAFITNVIDFVMIALCVFLFVKAISKLMPKKKEAPAVPMRECPFCKSQINAAATRCPECTSEVTPTVPQAQTV